MAKSCHCESDRRRLIRRILIGILAFIVLILFIVLLVWAILRPTKPRFILQDGTVYAFNLSSSTAISTNPSSSSPTDPTPNTLSLNMQVSLSSHNPNDRIGVYYHDLIVFASYRGQQISLPTDLPPTYQGYNDVSVWSPFLHGTDVLVSPYAVDSLREDLNAGEALVDVKVEGRVKWKVGTWESGRYHIFVSCPAYVKFAGEQGGRVGVVGPAMKLQLLQTCNVEV